MNPLLVAALGAAGLAAGPGLRTIAVRLAVPADEPARRDDRRALPPRPVVGAATAILLAALGARIHPGLILVAACWLALCAVPLAFVDAAVKRLPDVLTAAAYAGTVLFLLLAAAAGGHWGNLARAMLGGVVLAGCYLVLALIPSGLGLGDVKAAASLGTLLAWRSWAALMAGAFAGFALAGLCGAALLISGRATAKQRIPFGPFMIIGAFAVILAGRGGL